MEDWDEEAGGLTGEDNMEARGGVILAFLAGGLTSSDSQPRRPAVRRRGSPVFSAGFVAWAAVPFSLGCSGSSSESSNRFFLLIFGRWTCPSESESATISGVSEESRRYPPLIVVVRAVWSLLL